jgi:hypothetical protein
VAEQITGLQYQPQQGSHLSTRKSLLLLFFPLTFFLFHLPPFFKLLFTIKKNEASPIPDALAPHALLQPATTPRVFLPLARRVSNHPLASRQVAATGSCTLKVSYPVAYIAAEILNLRLKVRNFRVDFNHAPCTLSILFNHS